MIELKGQYCKDIKIFTDNVEESAMSTIYRIADCRAFKDRKIRIMPDCHDGKGIVIGFSCPIDLDKDHVNPEHVGCDIGCTISAVFFDKGLTAEDMKEFEHKIRKVIPFGFDINDKKKIDVKFLIKRFNGALNRMCSFYPQLAPYRVEMTTEKDLEAWCKKLNMDYGVFLKSVGTVGGGNHFLEYDVNDELGKYCICVHCGSRNLGLKVFNYWNKIAKSMAISKEEMRMLTDSVKSKNTDKKKLDAEIKAAKEEYLSKKIPGYLSGENLMGYLVDVLLAQEYARLNHETIIEQVVDIYRKMAKGVSVVDTIHTTHNYIDYDLKALMGKPHMMIRKGAIRAYEGERVIIPFNMRDGISICEGKSNEDWNFTAPHGCGRCLSRSKAKEQLNIEDFKATMEAAGVYTTTADASTLDESPAAYKPYEEIIKLIEPTVSVLYMMKPRMNIKAAE